MVVSAAEASPADLQPAVGAPRGAPGVLVKPPYYKRFFKQLWTLLYHKQGTHSHSSQSCSSHYRLTCSCCAAKVAFRNKSSTIIRLIVAPFLFILLVFVIDKAITSGNRSIAGTATLPLQCFQIKRCCITATTTLELDINTKAFLVQRTACRSIRLQRLLAQSAHVRMTCTSYRPAGMSCTRQTVILWLKQLYRAYRPITLEGPYLIARLVPVCPQTSDARQPHHYAEAKSA